jgi:hypothetical protein
MAGRARASRRRGGTSDTSVSRRVSGAGGACASRAGGANASHSSAAWLWPRLHAAFVHRPRSRQAPLGLPDWWENEWASSQGGGWRLSGRRAEGEARGTEGGWRGFSDYILRVSSGLLLGWLYLGLMELRGLDLESALNLKFFRYLNSQIRGQKLEPEPKTMVSGFPWAILAMGTNHTHRY